MIVHCGCGLGSSNNPSHLFRLLTCLLLPGWNVTTGREAGGARTAEVGSGGGVNGEAAIDGNKCVVLKDSFPVTQGGEGGDAPAEYFFWQVHTQGVLPCIRLPSATIACLYMEISTLS